MGCCFFFRIRKRTIRKLAKSLTKQSAEEMQPIRTGGALLTREGSEGRCAEPRRTVQHNAGYLGQSSVPPYPLTAVISYPKETHPLGLDARPRTPSSTASAAVQFGLFWAKSGAAMVGSGRAHFFPQGFPCPAKIPTPTRLFLKRAKRQLPAHPRRGFISLPTGRDKQDRETNSPMLGFVLKVHFVQK